MLPDVSGLDADQAPTSPGRVVAVIPARIKARRLPRKPLLELGGEPLVCRVLRRVSASPDIDAVVVATDDADVAGAVTRAGGRVCIIAGACDSGTQRVALAVSQEPALRDADTVINVQVDEAFFDAAWVPPLLSALAGGADVATLAAPLPPGALDDSAAVKVVRDRAGHALYFSRAPIPGDLHLGIYAFRRAALSGLAGLSRGPLARAEDLEQLAWMEAGARVHVVTVPRAALAIDTPQDLTTARAMLARRVTEPR